MKISYESSWNFLCCWMVKAIISLNNRLSGDSKSPCILQYGVSSGVVDSNRPCSDPDPCSHVPLDPDPTKQKS